MKLHLTQFELLQTAAESVIALFLDEHDGFPGGPPVPVEMMASLLFGLRCEARKLGRWGRHTAGALSSEGVVYADERCTWHQRVFSVAHEIGHLALHERKHPAQQSVGLENVPFWQILGSTGARTEKQKAWRREMEANRFAAALLMPRPFLFRAAASYKVIDARSVRDLAGVFQVSIMAMLYRVVNLDKHLAWKGPRIDLESLYQLEGVLAHPRSLGQADVPPGSRADQPGKGRTRRARIAHLLAQCTRILPFAPTAPVAEPAIVEPVGVRASVDGTPWSSQVSHFRRPEQIHAVRGTHGEPVIVELAGTPNAGKNTLGELLKDCLEDVYGYRVRFIDEAVRTRCHIDKARLDIHRVWKTVALTVVQLYEARFENPGNYDFVIVNRGLFDRLALLHAMCLSGRVSEEQERVHTDYLLSYGHLQDVVFLMLIPPEESIRREREAKRKFLAELAGDGLTVRSPRMHSGEMLEALNSSYLRAYHTYKELFDNRVYLLSLTERGDLTAKDETILAQARGMMDVVLQDQPQLPIPELVSFQCAAGSSSRKGKRLARKNAPKGTREPATQLPLL